MSVHLQCSKACIEKELEFYKLAPWRPWLELEENWRRIPEMDLGVFLWRWTPDIPRFDGSRCRLVYVGRGALQARLQSHFAFVGYPEWKKKLWAEHKKNVEIAWFTCKDYDAVRLQLIEKYLETHWELPPGNQMIEERTPSKKV